MYCVGFIPFNFVLASVKVPVYRTNDNGTLERVGTNVEGWVHGHCIDSNQKIQDEIDSVRASLAEIRGSGGTKGTVIERLKFHQPSSKRNLPVHMNQDSSKHPQK